VKDKVQRLLARLQELEELLGHPETLSDQRRYRELTQEHSQLSELKDVWDRLQSAEKQLGENRALLSAESDLEMAVLLREEIARLEIDLESAKKQIEALLVPPDPRDSRNIILELRGSGPFCRRLHPDVPILCRQKRVESRNSFHL
jgi:peptide chain release factor 1